MSDRGDLLTRAGAFGSGDYETINGDAASHIVEISLLL